MPRFAANLSMMFTEWEFLDRFEAAGFRDMRIGSHAPIAAAHRRTADLRNKLRTLLYRRFILCCRKERQAPAPPSA